MDERVRKDMSDIIALRIKQSETLLTNITPVSSRNKDANPQSKFIDYLVDLAQGNILHISLTLNLIEKGFLVIKSSSFKVLPVSLSEIFLLEFNLKFPSITSFDKVSDILSVCLASSEAMTITEIFQSVLALSLNSSLTWQEFIGNFNSLTPFLVKRADDTVMFYHPLFREWLIQRRESDPGKFLCDPRVGHLGIALRMSRGENGLLTPVGTLQLAYHVMNSAINTNIDDSDFCDGDLHTQWMSLSTGDLSEALGCTKNIFAPNVDISRLLLYSGASPLFTNGYLQSAPLLSVFSDQGNEDMIKLLLEFGADVNGTNSEGVTPLMFACIKGHLQIVRLLVESGALVFQSDRSDSCSLVYASKNGHLDVVEHLVSCDWQQGSRKNDISLKEAAQQALIASSASGKFQVKLHIHSK